MKQHDFIALVRSISYKPNWEIQCLRLPASDDLDLRIQFMAPDADRKRQEQIAINSRTIIPSELVRDFTPVRALRHIRQIILGVEEHETDEWFRVQGRRYREPHAA